jgi:multiple sugar transport system substrate-binding protein
MNMNRRTRAVALAGAALAAAMVAAGCTPGSAPAPIASPTAEPEGTVEFWHFFTDREARAIADVVHDFEVAHPKIHVVIKDGQDDSKMTQAISAGQGPDVGLSYSTDIVGQFCHSKAWVDLAPYIARDHVDMSKIPPTVQAYTKFENRQCTMPFLSDTYGLYYNKAMFAAAGISGPPHTLAELADDAKKLTKLNPNGSIKVAGFLPLFGFYENSPAHVAPMVGAKWLTADGKSAIGTDPGWPVYLNWQKQLVDYFGYDKLTKFSASLGDEFSADNAFQKGQVAINIDGEYRIAFIKDQAPTLDFGTAPVPTADGSHYGAGYITGNVIGISRNSRNPEAAWALIKYLTTDTKALVKLANGIKNVPTTTDSLHSPDLQLDPQFQVFLDIFNNPDSSTTPASAGGSAYQEAYGQFVDKWQSGKIPDLTKGLSDLDQQVNNTLQLTG